MPRITKILLIRPPYQGLIEVPWNAASIKKYGFTNFDIDELEHGDILWIDETAYSLAENEEGRKVNANETVRTHDQDRWGWA